MEKTHFFCVAIVATSILFTTTAFQAPPLLLVEDEDGVVEQPQPISSPNTTEQEETLVVESKSIDRTTTQPAKTQPATTVGGLVLVDEDTDSENQTKAAPTAEQDAAIKQAADAQQKAELRKLQEEKARAEKARQDSIRRAEEAERARIEQARQDSIRRAEEAVRIRIEKARQDSIRRAEEAVRIRIEKARQDSIRRAEEAERSRIEQARQDSIRRAEEAERIRIEQARQDSIRRAEEAERMRIEQARKDSIRRAEEESIRREQARKESIRKAEAEGKTSTNTQSDDLTTKMLEALQRAYEEAINQANKSDSIRVLQLRLEDEINKLKRQQAELDAYKQKEQEDAAAKQAAELAAQAAAQQQKAETLEKETVFTRYYKHSGRNMLSILSIGYSTYFQVGAAVANGVSPTADAFKRHLLSIEVFEWRAKCFGMQMFNFEMGLNTPFISKENPEQNRYLFERGGKTPTERVEATAKTMWFAYKPAIKFYIPCTKWLAVELYGGAEVDLTKMWSKMNTTYYTGNPDAINAGGLLIPEQNFVVGAFGGAGFMLTALPHIPLEIKAEYRQPITGNTVLVPQGIYISAQLHLAAPIKK